MNRIENEWQCSIHWPARTLQECREIHLSRVHLILDHAWDYVMPGHQVFSYRRLDNNGCCDVALHQNELLPGRVPLPVSLDRDCRRDCQVEVDTPRGQVKMVCELVLARVIRGGYLERYLLDKWVQAHYGGLCLLLSNGVLHNHRAWRLPLLKCRISVCAWLHRACPVWSRRARAFRLRRACPRSMRGLRHLGGVTTGCSANRC